MFDRRGRVVWLLAAFAMSPVASDAGDTQGTAPKTQSNERTTAEKPDSTEDSDAEVDDALLEFLGSVDSEDSDLMDYLARNSTTTPKAEKTADGVTQESTTNK